MLHSKDRHQEEYKFFQREPFFAVEVGWMCQEHRDHLDRFWQSLDKKKKADYLDNILIHTSPLPIYTHLYMVYVIHMLVSSGCQPAGQLSGWGLCQQIQS